MATSAQSRISETVSTSIARADRGSSPPDPSVTDSWELASRSVRKCHSNLKHVGFLCQIASRPRALTRSRWRCLVHPARAALSVSLEPLIGCRLKSATRQERLVGQRPGSGTSSDALGGLSEAMHRDQAGYAQHDHSERNRTPPVLPERGETMIALTPGPKHAEHDEHRGDHPSHAAHD